MARHRRQRQLRHALAGMWHELPGGSWVIRHCPATGIRSSTSDVRCNAYDTGIHLAPTVVAGDRIDPYVPEIHFSHVRTELQVPPDMFVVRRDQPANPWVAEGSVLAVARLGRCHPWQLGGINPPPPAGKWRADVDLDGNPRGYHVHPRVAGNRRLVDPRHVPCRTHPIFGAASGAAWGLSIVGLVIVIRTLLIPLFVKQIKAQRNLQILQPQMKEIQKKYAGDKERQSQEMMKLYRETGTNPLSSCLPILVQAPIFFALFRVLQEWPRTRPLGPHTGTGRPGSRGQHFRGSDLRHIPQRQRDPNPTATTSSRS